MNRSCVGLVQRQLALCFIFSLTHCRNLGYNKCSLPKKIILFWFKCTFQYCWNQFILRFLSSFYQLTSRSTSANSSHKKGPQCLLFSHIVPDPNLGCPGCLWLSLVWTLMFSTLLCLSGNVQKELREEKVEREMSSVSCCWPGCSMIRSW